MGRPKKNKEEKEEVKGVIAKGFIDIESYNEAARLAERRSEIIATLQQRIGGYEADMKGMQIKLEACKNNDQAVVEYTIETLCKLESSLTRGLGELGEITQADIVYNINLVKRIITKKYGRK
jgi:hypothetical protein